MEPVDWQALGTSLGPVQMLVLEFERERVTGEVLPELRRHGLNFNLFAERADLKRVLAGDALLDAGYKLVQRFRIALHELDVTAFKAWLMDAAASDLKPFARLAAGMTDEQLVATLLSSPEYQQHSGGSDRTWVQSLYLTLLGRSPAVDEVNGWLQFMRAARSCKIAEP